MNSHYLSIKKLESAKEKLFGLMFIKKIKPIYFETHFGIHTFFVKKPIDIIILDKKFIVRKLKTNLKPSRLLFWNPRYFRVIECPHGTIHRRGIKGGDKLDIKP